MGPPACWLWKRRSSDVALAAALACSVVPAARAAPEEVAAARHANDVGMFVEASLCGEEPLAERLRATVLLGLAREGQPASAIVAVRQAFLDALRQAGGQGRRPAAGACGDVATRVQSRLDTLGHGRAP